MPRDGHLRPDQGSAGAAHAGSRLPMLASLSICLLAARAARISIVDGVHLDLNDEAGFAASCRQGRELGFEGKTLIHPKQIEAANAAFGPADDEIAWARRIIAASMRPGRGQGRRRGRRQAGREPARARGAPAGGAGRGDRGAHGLSAQPSRPAAPQGRVVGGAPGGRTGRSAAAPASGRAARTGRPRDRRRAGSRPTGPPAGRSAAPPKAAPGHRADAADDGGGERLEAPERAHAEADDAVAGGDDEARRRPASALPSMQARRTVRSTSTPTRAAAAGIVGAGAIGAAERGPAQEQDHDADGARPPAAPAAAGPRLSPRRRSAVRPRRSGWLEEGLQPDAGASRRAGAGLRSSAMASPIVAISSACELRRRNGAKIRPYSTAPSAAPVAVASSRPASAMPATAAPSRAGRDAGCRCSGREGADRGEVAEREVDPPGDAVDQRVAGGEQGVDRGRGQRVDQLLQRDRPRRPSAAAVAAAGRVEPVGLEEEQAGRRQLPLAAGARRR